jgi:hypothetical protein
MSEALKMTLGTGDNAVDLHDYGTVSVLSQQASYSPDAFPQRETRTLVVRVDARAMQVGYNYDLLYEKMRAVRTALGQQNQVLKWVSPNSPDSGEVQLNRPVIVVSHDMPEDPNGWGVFWQQINITFRYELDRPQTGAITATVEGTATPHVPISLGQVTEWSDDWKNNFYSEWKNIKQRSPGTVTASGELFEGLAEVRADDAVDGRVALLVTRVADLNSQLRNGANVTLNYGTFIVNRLVKVESFNARLVDAATGKIAWTGSFSYTLFPSEAGYCGAEFTSGLSQDKETGMESLALAGKITAATQVLAMAKLSSLVSQMKAMYGFADANQTRTDVTQSWLNVNDTDGRTDADTTANKTPLGAATSTPGTAFLELSFNYAWTKKAANILSYTLNISDQDDLKSGLITRTYSGSVVASSTDEDAAYAKALAKARELGSDGPKHPFRVSANETRADRQTVAQNAAGTTEFLRVEFSYVYQIKGSRIYLELTSSVTEEAFGESQERMSGFLVAADEATARSQYALLVRAAYATRIVRSETLDVRTERAPDGYGLRAVGSDAITNQAVTNAGMFTRLDFSFALFKPKETGVFGIKYGLQIVNDYVARTTNTTVSGLFVAAPAQLAAIEAGTANELDTFLATLTGYGTRINRQIDVDKEQVGTLKDTVMVRFSVQYTKALVGGAALLKCQLSEEISYSGKRWVFQDVPDPDIGFTRAQDCGVVPAKRTVNGTVSAIDEVAAMGWIALQRSNAGGLWAKFPGTNPDGVLPQNRRYEDPPKITRSFEFVPMDPTALARGTSPTFQICNVSFTFSETIPNLPAPF